MNELRFLLRWQIQSVGAYGLKVIPVIDVLDGVVVHAVRGERKHYKPLNSIISDSSDPVRVAAVFRELGFGELYIADLNAIIGRGDNFHAIQRISKETGLRLMIDAGVAETERANTIAGLGTSSVVVGTETMTRIAFVEEAIQSLGNDRIIVSLDLRNGQLLAKFCFDGVPSLIAVLQGFRKMGVRRFIVLDLARVGSGQGVDIALTCEIVRYVDAEIFVGGGVRGINELLELRDIGVAGVLLATSLHSGKIAVDQIVANGFSMK